MMKITSFLDHSCSSFFEMIKIESLLDRVRSDLTPDHARVLNLEFSNVKVCHFFLSNLEGKDPSVGGTCIFNNPLFYLKLVAYFEKKFKAEF